MNPYAANLRKVYVFSALSGLMLFIPIWVVYLQEERGLSLGQVTAMEGPFWVAMVLCEVPTGAVADRFGRKTSLAIGMFVTTLAILIFAIATTYPLLFASYLLWAVGITLVSGADSAFIYDTLKALGRPQDFERVLGRVMAVKFGAMMTGSLAGATLADVTNLWLPVLVTALLHLVAFGVVLTFTEPPHEAEEEDAPAPGYLAGIREAGRICWNNQAIRYVLLVAAATLATSTTLSVLSQPFLRGHDVGIGLFGVLYLPGELLGMAGALVAYRLVRAVGPRAGLGGIMVVMLSVGVVFASVDSVFAFAALPVAALMAALAMPIVSGYINERIPSGQRATILSMQSFVLSLVLAGLLPLTGAVSDGSGMPAGYAVLTGVTATLGGVSFLLWLRADRGAKPVAPAGTVPGGAATPAG